MDLPTRLKNCGSNGYFLFYKAKCALPKKIGCVTEVLRAIAVSSAQFVQACLLTKFSKMKLKIGAFSVSMIFI